VSQIQNLPFSEVVVGVDQTDLIGEPALSEGIRKG
jgi:hypothetical protein